MTRMPSRPTLLVQYHSPRPTYVQRVAELIRREFKDRHLGIPDLARIIDRSYSTAQRTWNGKRSLLVREVIQIAHNFDIPPASLLPPSEV